ncbi:putative mannose-1-phosphate guanylyltransferase [Selenomonas ruminantium subsp. lactilytica TAM6421]|uniref:Putative mannose-1-phosphate guanylyltransferase n=1 Tax=Selenomonas ruminantium subsp. lactilytica (strain NBRC 103574 / TAM6421) TaxID=927704 RepID=I0GRP6_SELRL|nr:putative mannose-1-phosphate guanylyltransferase [Selenomonas ruminantium subsp. lactilytica TAM6421]
MMEKLHIVLLSGGSGKRLWPLSNDIRSKQFIPLFPQVDGEYISMAQRVFRQIRKVNQSADVTVATSKSQVSTLKNQLGDNVDISVEPCRRDTFPAIVLVSAYLHDVKGVGLDEAVAVCPVDPYVSTDYYKAVQHLTELAAEGTADLMLMGIEPTYPSEKYGYIMPASKDEVSKVVSFKEKPTAAKAADYIARGALWNGGVFAYRLGYVLEKAHELLDFKGYEDLYANYGNLTKISFDYAVVEKEQSIGVLRYAGEWKDLGTWNTLTEIMHEPAIGDVTMDDNCSDTHVVNEMDIPILVMGASNLVVAASPEGILVADKDASSHIKPYVENLTQQVRFAEKSWGSFQIIDVEDESLTIKVTLNAGHGMNYHSHEHRREIWNIVSGEGTVLLDGKERTVKAGDIVELPIGSKHKITAGNRMTIMEVQLGEAISKADKIKWE